MRKLMITEIIFSILEILFCGLTFSFFLTVLARALFGIKLLGIKISLSLIISLEFIAVVFLMVLPYVFMSDLSWTSVLVKLLFASISSLMVWYDEENYVYIEEEK